MRESSTDRFYAHRRATVPIYIFCFACAGAMFLSACHRHPTVATERAPGDLSTTLMPNGPADLGEVVLAEVDNARFAIEKNDRVAAYNDVNQALEFAQHLADQSSDLLPSSRAATGTDSSSSGAQFAHDRTTAFEALVKLGSARTELEDNPAAADTDLHAIQAGIPQQAISSDLPLLRAAAGLDLAQNALSEGRVTELRTQLATAQTSLTTYAGPGHTVEARALAAAINQTLTQDSSLTTLSLSQISSWRGSVTGWAGIERWSNVTTAP